MSVQKISKRRFNALAGYARQPEITRITREIAAFADPDEHVLGLVLLDLIDNDYSWVMFGRDELHRYRAVNCGASLSTLDQAHQVLRIVMEEAASASDAFSHQGDTTGDAVDFFAPLITEEKRHATFKLLATEERYSPAREIIQSMMRYHSDVDGNFIKNYQAGGFDARLWELYLWATFTELGYVRRTSAQVPDFVFRGNQGELAIEAVSANPPDQTTVPTPTTNDEAIDHFENYIPIRLAGALKSKLNRKPSYWEEPGARGLPFCIAVQDFSGGGSMRFIALAANEYLFGVRHGIENGKRKIDRIQVHRFGKQKAQSGFFLNSDGAENVSAVIVNPQGTLPKFNRLGYAAGFGSRSVRMVRKGVQRNERNASAPEPTNFVQHVDRRHNESWVEGMVVIHNPNALIPLDPSLVPGAAHEFLQEDGRILSLLPEFHPLFSVTEINLQGRSS